MDELEDAEDLRAAPGHEAVARLRPAELPVAVHDGRGAIGDVALLVPDVVGLDHPPVHVAQERTLKDGRQVVNVGATPEGAVVVIEADGKRAGVLVDDLLAQQQVVIKSLESNFKAVPGIAGATILGDGTVALIIDVPGLIRSVAKQGLGAVAAHAA